MIKTVVQALGFLGVSLGLHLGVAAWVGHGHSTRMTGAEGAGDAGLHRVSLAAAPQDLAILVENWTRPPEAGYAAAPPLQPPMAPQTHAPILPQGAQTAASDHALPSPILAPTTPDSPPDLAPSPPPQVARGTGQLGQNGATTETIPEDTAQSQRSNGAVNQLMSTWGRGILTQLERSRGRPRGQGTATLRLVIDANGHLQEARILTSTGQAELDHAILAFVERASPYPSAPDGLSRPIYNFDLPVRLR